MITNQQMMLGDPLDVRYWTGIFSATPTAGGVMLNPANWVGQVAPPSDSGAIYNIVQFNQATYSSQPNAGTALKVYGVQINAGSGAVTISGTSLTIGVGALAINSAATASIISAGVVLGNSQTWSIGQNLSCSGVISGAFILTKTGVGTLTLTATNTFSAGLKILAGKVTGSLVAGSFGTGTITIGDTAGSSDATLDLGVTSLTRTNNIVTASGSSGIAYLIGNTGTHTISGTIVLGKSLTFQNTGSTLNITGAISGTGDIICDSGSVINFTTGTMGMTGKFTNNSGATVGVSMVIGSSVTQINQTGSGSLLITGNNFNYAGITTLSSGTLTAVAFNCLGGTSSTLVINGGTLNGPASSFTHPAGISLQIGGNFAFSSGGGPLHYLGTVNLMGGVRTITPSTAQYLCFNGVVSNGGITLAAFAGSKLYLGGANTYTGATTVGAGSTLFVANPISAVSASLGATPISVSGTIQGAASTGLSATATGTVTVDNTAGATLIAGAFGNNTFNTGALTFNGTNSRLQINSTTTAMSKVNVTGTCALGGVGVIFPAGITTNGVYPIIVASGVMSGTLPTIITNSTGKTLVLSQSGNTLNVTVS